MKILISGSNGFIGKNLTFRLNEKNKYNLSTISREENENSF